MALPGNTKPHTRFIAIALKLSATRFIRTEAFHGTFAPLTRLQAHMQVQDYPQLIRHLMTSVSHDPLLGGDPLPKPGH